MLLTLDLYKKLWNPKADEGWLVRFGQWSGTMVLLSGTLIAFYYTRHKESFLFVIIQNVFAYIAPPFAVVFTLGILWRRANATGALATILAGFPFMYFLQYYLFSRLDFLRLYGSYLHRALLSWAFCMVVMISVSLLTRPPAREKSVGPGKRPLNNVAPMIVRMPDRDAATGLRGGRKIISVSAQICQRMIDFGAAPREAATAPRIHVETQEPVELSESIDPSILEALSRMGHQIRTVPEVGAAAHTAEMVRATHASPLQIRAGGSTWAAGAGT